MPNNTAEFKGFRQVTATEYDKATDKKGYIWFVRPDSGSTSGDIYLGTRCYGQYNSDMALTVSDVENLWNTTVAE